jgi:hypothetical protein
MEIAREIGMDRSNTRLGVQRALIQCSGGAEEHGYGRMPHAKPMRTELMRFSPAEWRCAQCMCGQRRLGVGHAAGAHHDRKLTAGIHALRHRDEECLAVGSVHLNLLSGHHSVRHRDHHLHHRRGHRYLN